MWDRYKTFYPDFAERGVLLEVKEEDPEGFLLDENATRTVKLTPEQVGIVRHVISPPDKEITASKGGTKVTVTVADPPIRLLHTPPGTGKTFMATVALINVLMRQSGDVGLDFESLQGGVRIETTSSETGRAFAPTALVVVPTHLRSQWEKTLKEVTSYYNESNKHPKKVFLHAGKIPWESLRQDNGKAVHIVLRRFPWSDTQPNARSELRNLTKSLFSEEEFSNFENNSVRCSLDLVCAGKVKLKRDTIAKRVFTFAAMLIDEADGYISSRNTSLEMYNPSVSGPIIVCQASVMIPTASIALMNYSMRLRACETVLDLWRDGFRIYAHLVPELRSSLEHEPQNVINALDLNLDKALDTEAGLASLAYFYAYLLPKTLVSDLVASLEKGVPKGILELDILAKRTRLSNYFETRNLQEYLDDIGSGFKYSLKSLAEWFRQASMMRSFFAPIKAFLEGSDCSLALVLRSAYETEDPIEIAYPSTLVDLRAWFAFTHSLCGTVGNQYKQTRSFESSKRDCDSLMAKLNFPKGEMECMVCAIPIDTFEQLCSSQCCTAIMCVDCFKSQTTCSYCTKQPRAMQLEPTAKRTRIERVSEDEFSNYLVNKARYEAPIPELVTSIATENARINKYARLLVYVPMRDCRKDKLKAMEESMNRLSGETRIYILTAHSGNRHEVSRIMGLFNTKSLKSVVLVLTHSSLSGNDDQVSGFDMGNATGLVALFEGEVDPRRKRQLYGRVIRYNHQPGKYIPVVTVRLFKP